jgi:hypothetical protein
VTPPNHCATCDAIPGECEHPSARYLPEIVYGRAESGFGWRVPDHERERWEHPPKAVRAEAPTEEPKPLQRLVVELEAWLDLDPFLERELRRVYEGEPLRVTRAAEQIVRDVQAGRLRSPGGLLRKRLREIAAREQQDIAPEPG